MGSASSRGSGGVSRGSVPAHTRGVPSRARRVTRPQASRAGRDPSLLLRHPAQAPLLHTPGRSAFPTPGSRTHYLPIFIASSPSQVPSGVLGSAVEERGPPPTTKAWGAVSPLSSAWSP